MSYVTIVKSMKNGCINSVEFPYDISGDYVIPRQPDLQNIVDENFIGVILKGQAFKCPLEQGPIKDNEKSKLTFSPDEYQYLLYSNFDDGFFFNRHLHRPPPPPHFFRGKRFHRRH